MKYLKRFNESLSVNQKQKMLDDLLDMSYELEDLENRYSVNIHNWEERMTMSVIDGEPIRVAHPYVWIGGYTHEIKYEEVKDFVERVDAYLKGEGFNTLIEKDMESGFQMRIYFYKDELKMDKYNESVSLDVLENIKDILIDVEDCEQLKVSYNKFTEDIIDINIIYDFTSEDYEIYQGYIRDQEYELAAEYRATKYIQKQELGIIKESLLRLVDYLSDDYDWCIYILNEHSNGDESSRFVNEKELEELDVSEKTSRFMIDFRKEKFFNLNQANESVNNDNKIEILADILIGIFDDNGINVPTKEVEFYISNLLTCWSFCEWKIGVDKNNWPSNNMYYNDITDVRKPDRIGVFNLEKYRVQDLFEAVMNENERVKEVLGYYIDVDLRQVDAGGYPLYVYDLYISLKKNK